jgi:GT2 family glycosyltransferase
VVPPIAAQAASVKGATVIIGDFALSSIHSLAVANREVVGLASIDDAAHSDPTKVFVIGPIVLVCVDRTMISQGLTALNVDGVEIPGPLFLSTHGQLGFIAAHNPKGFGSVRVITTLRLTASNRDQVLRYVDKPLAVRHERAAVADLLNMLRGRESAQLAMMLLRIVSAFAPTFSEQLIPLVQGVVETLPIAEDVRTSAFGPRLRYCRFRPSPPPADAAPGCSLPVRCLLYSKKALRPVAGRRALFIDGTTAHLLLPDLPPDAGGTLIVQLGATTVSLQVGAVASDPMQVAIETIAAADPANAQPLKLFLLSRLAEVYRSGKARALLDAGNMAWAMTQFANRAFVRPDMEFGVSIENILPVPGRGVLLIGWLWDPAGLLGQLVLTDGQGRKEPIAATLHRYDRPDVLTVFNGRAGDRPGLIAFCPFTGADDLWPTYQIKAVLKDGTSIDLGTDIKASQRLLTQPEILLGLLPAGKLDASLFQDIAPAVSYLQTKTTAAAGIARVLHYYRVVAKPRTSIVVPIYKRLDHARHQLAQFADDPDLDEVELIYVLDSPELLAEFSQLLDATSRLYRRSATLVVMQANRGFAGATNAGASVARGRFVLLLNSDVIPQHPGWCRTLEATLEADPQLGAVGARLIYEDGAIQHAGMQYQADASGTWKSVHPGKGLCVERPSGPVPAVTAACMMLPTELYRRLGGLSEDYVVGDFEDSDLCLKLHQDNKGIWYCVEATLYHLERQSMGVNDRYNTTVWRYNQLLHQHRWRQAIAQLVASSQQSTPSPSISPPPTTDCGGEGRPT